MIQTDLYSFGYKTGTLVPWCKKCTNKTFHKDGKTSYGQQLYKCKSCGFRFVWCSDLPNRRFFSNVIDFVVDIYTTTGIGLRTVARKLFKFFRIKLCTWPKLPPYSFTCFVHFAFQIAIIKSLIAGKLDLPNYYFITLFNC